VREGKGRQGTDARPTQIGVQPAEEDNTQSE
jgi:hypothetical protein